MSSKRRLGTTYYFAIDNEACKPEMDLKAVGYPSIIQIGVAFGTESGLIDSRSFCGVVPPDSEFDAGTLAFWNSSPEHKATLARIRAESTPDMFEAFTNYFSQLDAIYGPFGVSDEKVLVMLSDNPSFDLGELSMALGIRLGRRLSLHYADNGSYINVMDPTEMLHGLPTSIAARVKKSEEKKRKNLHWAQDDAIYIFNLFIAAKAAVEKLELGMEYLEMLSQLDEPDSIAKLRKMLAHMTGQSTELLKN
jgi:hypothetical protein